MAKEKIAGKVHKVSKNSKGDIVVSHPGGGPTIDLTKKDKKINTVSKGLAASKQWHRNNSRGR